MLDLYGVQAAELTGRVPMAKRNSVLCNFKESTRDHGPRVLLLSNVGTVGLNISHANILIMVVSDGYHLLISLAISHHDC